MKNTHFHIAPVQRALLAGATVALAAIILSGCEAATGTPVSAPPAATAVPVSIVVETPIVETQEFSGRFEAIEHIQIRARVGGFINSVNFKPGSEVRKGDVLFVIDQRPFQTELARAEAASSAAHAKADLAKIELTRAEHLLADKAIAQREFDETSASVKELNANLRAAQAALEGARLNLTYTEVRAPIDGRVGKAEITLGNLVDNAAVLTSLVSTKRIYAGFDGDEDTLLRVSALAHKGLPVTVNAGLANETGFPHPGKLEFIDNQLDVQTGSVRMRAVFENSDNSLVPGLFARVRLDTGNGGSTPTRALLINEKAIGTDQNRKYVYLVDAAGKAEYRAVTLGQVVNDMRLVRSGLRPGDRIVVNGLQRVQPGSLLAPQMVPMQGSPNAPAGKPGAAASASAQKDPA